MGTQMGTARWKSLEGSSAAIMDTALLVDPVCCQCSPQGLCSKRVFAETSVAGGVSEWIEVGGRCHLSPFAMHDHVTYVCRLVGDSFPRGLAACLGPGTAFSQGAKPLSVPQKGSVKWQVTGVYGRFTPANGWKLLPKASLQCVYFLCICRLKLGKIWEYKQRQFGQLGSNCLHKLLMKNISSQGHIYITACAAFIRLSVWKYLLDHILLHALWFTVIISLYWISQRLHTWPAEWRY